MAQPIFALYVCEGSKYCGGYCNEVRKFLDKGKTACRIISQVKVMKEGRAVLAKCNKLHLQLLFGAREHIYQHAMRQVVVEDGHDFRHPHPSRHPYSHFRIRVGHI